ncbi:hypothetical protein LINPERHAP2_LOCUS28966 [Linum perenne]
MSTIHDNNPSAGWALRSSSPLPLVGSKQAYKFLKTHSSQDQTSTLRFSSLFQAGGALVWSVDEAIFVGSFYLGKKPHPSSDSITSEEP